MQEIQRISVVGAAGKRSLRAGGQVSWLWEGGNIFYTGRCAINNYEKNAKIIHEICTKEELEVYFSNSDVRNDPNHIVNIVLTRIAETLHDNPFFSFASYTSDDIYQFCWEWCIENLQAGKYHSRTSLYGYLEVVCKNKIKKLRRDKQWRTDISDQNACRQCKHRDTCDRKVTYADLDTEPKCKVMKAALERNFAKHTLSVQADYDITEPACHRTQHIKRSRRLSRFMQASMMSSSKQLHLPLLKTVKRRQLLNNS